MLLDVVLGHAADPDPACRLAPAIRARDRRRGRGRPPLTVVVALCGTAATRRTGRPRPTRWWRRGRGCSPRTPPRRGPPRALAVDVAGGRVRPRAVRPIRPIAATAADAGLRRRPPAGSRRRRRIADRIGARPSDLLAGPPSVICAGIDLLADALRGQAVDVITVDYRPPTFDTADAAAVPAALPAVLADPRRAAANALAAQRMLAVRARLVDVRPAREALGLQPGEFCHAGPPIEFARASGPLRGALIGAMIFEGLAADEAEAIAKLEGGRGHLARPVPRPARGRADGRASSRRRCGCSNWPTRRPGRGRSAR